jgi:hypothetical protein
VPLTVEEMRALARELKPLADRDLVYLAEDDGEPVGVSVTVPDINQALRAANGRLLPFGLLRLLAAAASTRCVLIMGVLQGHRFRGVDAARSCAMGGDRRLPLGSCLGAGVEPG